MIELRKHVERIVRPIRASNRRKDRMREELLAHLTTIYDEELMQRPDAAAALAAAVGRFGDPTTLRAELQGSVSWLEQLTCTPWQPAKKLLGRRPGESIREFVIRSCLRSMGINAAVWLTFLVFLWTTGVRRPERAHETSLAWFTVFIAVYVLVVFPISAFGQVVLGEKTWHALQVMRGSGATFQTRRVLPVLGYLAASMALYAAVAAAMLLLINRVVRIPLVSDFWFWAIILLASLFGPIVVLLQLPDLRRWDAWDGLVLDEQGAAGDGLSSLAS